LVSRVPPSPPRRPLQKQHRGRRYGRSWTRRRSPADAESRRTAGHDVRAQAAGIVLQRSELRTAADGGDAVARRRGAVGGGSVPEPCIEGEGGSGRALGWNRGDLVGNAGIGLSAAQMAPRHDPGCAVVGGEIGDHPHDIGGGNRRDRMISGRGIHCGTVVPPGVGRTGRRLSRMVRCRHPPLVGMERHRAGTRVLDLRVDAGDQVIRAEQVLDQRHA